MLLQVYCVAGKKKSNTKDKLIIIYIQGSGVVAGWAAVVVAAAVVGSAVVMTSLLSESESPPSLESLEDARASPKIRYTLRFNCDSNIWQVIKMGRKLSYITATRFFAMQFVL